VGKFGDKFRKERERQGIKLEDVSNATKISSRMLRAIEDEHFDQLPGGVFNKGFIRTYAKHLGLDDEESVAAYLATLQQNGHAGSAAAAPSDTDRRTPHSGERWHGRDRRGNDRRNFKDRRSSDPLTDELPDLQLPKAEHVHPRRRMAVHGNSGGIPWRVPALVVLAMVAGALLWSNFRNARGNPAAGSVAPSPMSPAVTTAPASSNDGAAKEMASAPSSGVHSVATSTLRTASPTSSAKSPSSQSAPPGDAPNSANAKKEGAQPGTDTDSSPPTPRPRANLFLIIRASENSWISVTADGQPVIQETLIAPAHASVSARREIVARAGNAAGVTFSLNGQEFPAQGAEGEVRTLIFDTSGIHAAAPLAPPTPGAATVPPDPTH